MRGRVEVGGEGRGGGKKLVFPLINWQVERGQRRREEEVVCGSAPARLC